MRFFWYDDEQDHPLVENLQELWPATLLISVVLGPNSQIGRLWLSPKQQLPAGRLIVIGEGVQYLPRDGLKPRKAPTPLEIFDRATVLTGSGAFALLSQMTAAWSERAAQARSCANSWHGQDAEGFS